MILVKRFAGFSLISLALVGFGVLIGYRHTTIQQPDRFVIISEAKAFDTKTGKVCIIDVSGPDISKTSPQTKIDLSAGFVPKNSSMRLPPERPVLVDDSSEPMCQTLKTQ